MNEYDEVLNTNEKNIKRVLYFFYWEYMCKCVCVCDIVRLQTKV